MPNPVMNGSWEEVEDGVGAGSMLLRVFAGDDRGGCEVEGGSGRSSIVVRFAVVMIVGPVDPRVSIYIGADIVASLKSKCSLTL